MDYFSIHYILLMLRPMDSILIQCSSQKSPWRSCDIYMYMYAIRPVNHGSQVRSRASPVCRTRL